MLHSSHQKVTSTPHAIPASVVSMWLVVNGKYILSQFQNTLCVLPDLAKILYCLHAVLVLPYLITCWACDIKMHSQKAWHWERYKSSDVSGLLVFIHSHLQSFHLQCPAGLSGILSWSWWFLQYLKIKILGHLQFIS